MSSSVANSWINTRNQLAVQPTKYTVVVPQVHLLFSSYTLHLLDIFRETTSDTADRYWRLSAF